MVNISKEPSGRSVMEEIVTISKFKATCLSLLDQVNKTGQPILVTKKGEPIAQVVPPPKPKKPASWLGSFRSTGKIKGDIVSPVRTR
jgi:prevent-host-death family protein